MYITTKFIIQILRKTEIKYLGMTIDSKLTWKQYIAKK
jgi:hypothetical protein